MIIPEEKAFRVFFLTLVHLGLEKARKAEPCLVLLSFHFAALVETF